jgi:hypothetical protein
MQHYVMKYVSELWQVGGFIWKCHQVFKVGYGVKHHFHQYFSYIAVVSFIGE